MKYRSDYVTNSSSSSFIVARKGEFTIEQLKAMIDVIEHDILGDVLLTPDASEEEIQRVLEECNGYCYEKHEAEIRRCLKEGKTIYSGTIDFEFVDPEIGSVLKKMWKAASANGEFTGIATDLSY